MDRDESHGKESHNTNLWLNGLFRCDDCLEVFTLDLMEKGKYGEELCPECAIECESCRERCRREDITIHNDVNYCPECYSALVFIENR